ncbi:alanine aminotransferase 2-like [Centropristis striata]|uniref:alanine aminotransferase 2-like n=1 Tax=Centropristis striata TaxID=184440 RepID=UPI0027DFD848|nr:alanine aminotransferase 2-like [Centropristis striata]
MTSLLEVNPTVRGIRPPTSLHSLAARITQEISQGVEKPFQQVIDVSLGDFHRAGMAPISFVRQVLAASLYSELLQDVSLPLDARQRAQKLLEACNGGSVGSYSVTACGLPYVHRSIAEFIMRRDDGVTSNPEHIISSSGSYKALSIVLHLLASREGETQTGVLTPAPCPHTLPALLDEAGVTLVPYRLVEERGWAVDLDELHRALRAARGRCNPRAIYISNPGNPTGHVQDRKSIAEVIGFAAAEGLVLLADEVYQDSVYGLEQEFISYKRVLFEMGREYFETVELVSFHSTSSACMGECGLRGEYMEVINMDPAVFPYLEILQASPPVLSLLALEVMVNPPTPGDLSYQTYSQEILHSQLTLSQNAQRACEFLNDLPGMDCRPGMGGVFLYPRLNLPPQMVEEAQMLGVQADVLYCQRFLEEEGVCLGAGSENGQQDPNYHIRLCVLAPAATLDQVLARLGSFHRRLLDTFP